MRIKNYNAAWFLLIVGFLFVLLRLPSLIEPNWYKDEGIYQVVGKALLDGRVLYRDIWDNKPPLLYLIYAFANGNLFLVKLLSLLSGLASVFVFFKLTQRLFEKTLSQFLSTFIYAIVFSLPLLEGNIANAENFMLLPLVSAGYFTYSYFENKEIKQLYFAGFLLSIALITKVVAVFDFAALLLFLIFSVGIKFGRKDARAIILFVGSFISLLLLSSLYFLLSGSIWDFINGVVLQNIPYVGEQNSADSIAAMPLVKLLMLVVFTSSVFYYRKRIPFPLLFVLLWLVFAVYSAFFSARPYIHYLLIMLPSVSLIIGSIFEFKKYRIFIVALCIIVIYVSNLYFQPYKRNREYYINYFQFILGQKKIADYQAFFDRETPRDYAVATFIRSHTTENESVFLWSDSAQIYSLSDKLPIGKYSVAYHITYYKDAENITMKSIDSKKPKYIIITIEKPIIRDLLSSYQLKYIMEGVKIYERKI